jgi:hypothetical protein
LAIWLLNMPKEHQSLGLPDGGRVVVYDWMGSPSPYRNLVCVGPDGKLRWTAELPTTEPADCFVGIRRDGDALLANSWSCYAVWINPVTGESLKREFTK